MTPEDVIGLHHHVFHNYCDKAGAVFLLENTNKAYRMAVAHWCLRTWTTEKPETEHEP